MDNPTNPTDKLLLNVYDVAETLGLSVSRTYAMMNKGTIPSVRIGKSVRVRPADLYAWMKTLAVREANPQVERLSR